jgi:hypothetical protein
MEVKLYTLLEGMKIQKKFNLDVVNIIAYRKINGILMMMFSYTLQEVRAVVAYLKII